MSVDLVYAGRLQWDIDRDVIRGRGFDPRRKLVPDTLSLVDRLDFLDAGERLLASQVQGVSYCRLFGLLERVIGARSLDRSRAYADTDAASQEAFARFTHEEQKHEELFRRVARLSAEGMRRESRIAPEAEAIAATMLGRSAWALLGLTCHVELIAQVHYQQSLEPDATLSDLFKDVLFFHAKEEWQHAMLHQAEWEREDARLAGGARDRVVTDLIQLIRALDAIVAVQAAVDVDALVDACDRAFSPAETARLHSGMLRAYRWQFIACGLEDARFAGVLSKMLREDEIARMRRELAPVVPRPAARSGEMSSALRTAGFWRALRGVDGSAVAG